MINDECRTGLDPLREHSEHTGPGRVLVVIY